MNIITFNYTKNDGKVSTRSISPVVTPNGFYEGTDLSELEGVDQVQYCIALGKLHDEYLTKVLALQKEYDLNNRYRRFDPSKMDKIVKQAV